MNKKIVTAAIGLAIILGLSACGQTAKTQPISSSESNTAESVETSSAGSNVSGSSEDAAPSDKNSSSATQDSVTESGSVSSDASAENSSASLPSNSGSSEGSVSAESRDETAAESKDESNIISEPVEDTTASDNNEVEGRKKVSVKATGDVLIDSDGFHAEIMEKSFTEDGYSWMIHCENNTGNTVYFGFENVCINGVVAVPFFVAEVEPGSSADQAAEWYMDLADLGIDTPVIIEGKLNVIDKDSYNVTAGSEFVVCPKGENEAYYVTRTSKDTDINILSNDYIDFLANSFSQNEYDQADMKVYITNKSDKNIAVTIDGCYINDAEADPFWAIFLPAKKSIYSDIYWSSEDLQSIGIDSFDKIEKVVSEISVYELETYEIFSNDIITLNF